jgi:hypothetical protein
MWSVAFDESSMPVRVKSKAPPPPRSFSPASGNTPHYIVSSAELPQIGFDDAFKDIVTSLSVYFNEVIELPSSFEQLRNSSAGDFLRVLVDHLGKTCTNPAIVNALLSVSPTPTVRGVDDADHLQCASMALPG